MNWFPWLIALAVVIDGYVFYLWYAFLRKRRAVERSTAETNRNDAVWTSAPKGGWFRPLPNRPCVPTVPPIPKIGDCYPGDPGRVAVRVNMIPAGGAIDRPADRWKIAVTYAASETGQLDVTQEFDAVACRHARIAPHGVYCPDCGARTVRTPVTPSLAGAA